MGDTEKGSWTSRELGRHINEEQARAVERVGHTAGPWKISYFVCHDDAGKELWRIARSIGPVTPDHNHWAGWNLGVEEADARLIAAAPELLQSLEEMVAGFGYAVQNGITAKLIERARAAIAKATGGQS